MLRPWAVVMIWFPALGVALCCKLWCSRWEFSQIMQMGKCFSFKGKNPWDCIHVASVLSAEQLWNSNCLYLCVLPLECDLRSISSLLPLLSSFTLWSAISIKAIEWKSNWQVATNHCSWLFVLVHFGSVFLSPCWQRCIPGNSTGKAFNSFKICS